LTTAELSWLLWATQGVKGIFGGTYATLRTVPSAGARHALETYLVINRVAEIAAGLYQYLPLEHALAGIPADEGMARRVAAACLGQGMVVQSAVTWIWTAVPYRMTWRYGQRGYRYLHLDAGHACQNLYLAAEALHAGCCAVAAFDDERMSGLLQLDPAEEFVIYLATVGKL
jgi:SagB-type dehydrogenase family enzyme